MNNPGNDPTKKEISCRVTRTLLMYVKEGNNGSLGHLLDDLALDESYLSDPNNWVSHWFLQILYHRMIDILGDENAVYKMTLASERYQSLGLLDRIGRLLGSPKLIYSQAPKYNKMLKLNGDVYVHEMGDSWVLLEDRYHDSAQKTRFDCDYTRGVLAGIPTAFGMPVADVEEIECQVAPETYGKRAWEDKPLQGRQGCLYRIRWNPKEKPKFLKRLFNRRHVYLKAIEDLQNANQIVQEKYEEVKQLARDLEAANTRLIDSQRELESKQGELTASERKYRILAENATDIIWTLNLETMAFDYVSPSVKRIRGFTPEEAMELDVEGTLSPQSIEQVTKALEEELANEERGGFDPQRSRTMEVQHRCKDGSYAWAEATMSFIRDKGGRPIGIMGVSRDISERKQAEERARELTAQLHRAQKMEAIGTLAAGVAHDLNNILAGLITYPELLLEQIAEDSPLRKRVIAIQKSGERAAAIVQDLLTLARRGVNVKEVVDLNTIVSEFLASHEINELIQKHLKIHLWSDLSDDLLNVKASPTHLSKVLMNLVANAAEAMPAGGQISILTQNVYLDRVKNGYELLPEGEFVLLRVRDEGIGISEKDLKRIFDPFYTQKSARRSGSGLGMTVIWATVKDHDGYIDVSSKEDKGTQFDIYLPATREELVEKPTRVVLEDNLGTERILVVDDIKEQREIAVEMLTKLGYEVSAVSNGEEAVRLMKTQKPDLLVLDMIMHPGIDGLETYRRIIAEHPNQKAIIASGYSELERVKELQRLGAGVYVQKPYTLQNIGLAVRKELDRVN